uniref:RNA helicase n=1 Tax=Strongyloides papillosus TaxID=174720 RepID=A0A0N5C2M3_STREA
MDLTKNFFKDVLAKYERNDNFTNFSEITARLQINDIVGYTSFCQKETVCGDGSNVYNYCVLDEIPEDLIESLVEKKHPIIDVTGVSIYPKFRGGLVIYIVRLLSVKVVAKENKIVNPSKKLLNFPKNPVVQTFADTENTEVVGAVVYSSLENIGKPGKKTIKVRVVDKSLISESKDSINRRRSIENGDIQEVHVPKYNFGFVVVDEFGFELKFVAFNYEDLRIINSLELGYYYLLKMNNTKTRKKVTEFGYKTNLPFEIVLNANTVAFDSLPKSLIFPYPKIDLKFSSFVQIKASVTGTFNIIGTIVDVDQPSPFVTNEEKSKKSVISHIYLVDEYKQVIAVSLFGHKCFKFTDKDIRKPIAIRNLVVRATNNVFVSLSATSSTFFYNYPEASLEELKEVTDKFVLTDLEIPVLKKVETEDEVMQNLYSVQGISTEVRDNVAIMPKVIFGFFRIYQWGNFYSTSKADNVVGHIYAKCTIYDNTGVMEDVSVFTNKIAKFMGIPHTQLVALYKPHDSTDMHKLIDPAKDRLMFLKISIKCNTKNGRVYINKQIDDMRHPNMDLYNRIVSQTTEYMIMMNSHQEYE